MADEILGLQLASIQNLSFYLWLVGEARKHIQLGDYSSWKKVWSHKLVNAYNQTLIEKLDWYILKSFWRFFSSPYFYLQ